MFKNQIHCQKNPDNISEAANLVSSQTSSAVVLSNKPSNADRNVILLSGKSQNIIISCFKEVKFTF